MSKKQIGIPDILALFEDFHRKKVENFLSVHLINEGTAIRYMVRDKVKSLSVHDLYFRLKGLQPREGTYIAYDLLLKALQEANDFTCGPPYRSNRPKKLVQTQ